MVDILQQMNSLKVVQLNLSIVNIKVKGQLKYFYLLGVFSAIYSLTAYQI